MDQDTVDEMMADPDLRQRFPNAEQRKLYIERKANAAPGEDVSMALSLSNVSDPEIDPDPAPDPAPEREPEPEPEPEPEIVLEVARHMPDEEHEG